MTRMTWKKKGTGKAIASLLSVLLCADMILTSVPVYAQTEATETIAVEDEQMLQTGDGELSISENETVEEQENGAEDYEGNCETEVTPDALMEEILQAEQVLENDTEAEDAETENEEVDEPASETVTIVHSGKDGDLDWSIDSEGHLLVEGNGDYEERKYNSYTTGWLAYAEEIKTATVNVTGITSAAFMFCGCINMTSLDLSKLETGSITDMQFMFFFCSSLKNLDVSGFDTSAVTSMFGMFSYCSSLSSLDLSNFDTKSVTDMNMMFCRCSSLSDLNLSSFDTRAVTGMMSLFSNCGSLEELDLSGFDTHSAIYMSDMFSGCSSLTSLDLSGFDTSAVQNISNMFMDCESLTSLDISKFNLSNVKNADELFYGLESLMSLTLPANLSLDIELPYYIYVVDEIGESDYIKSTSFVWKDSDGKIQDKAIKGLSEAMTYTKSDEPHIHSGQDGDLTWYLENGNLTVSGNGNFEPREDKVESEDENNSLDKPIVSVSRPIGYEDVYTPELSAEIGGFSLRNDNCDTGWLAYKDEIKTAAVDVTGITSTKDMFAGCKQLETVKFNHFDTDKVTDMSGMFSECGSLVNVDVSGFDTSAVNNMAGMFYDCYNLKNLDVSGFDTKAVTNMCLMFSGCKALDTLNMSGFDTSTVINMAGMFSGCENLASLDVSNFDTHAVKTMGAMFSGCYSLEKLDVSGFDTSSVIIMRQMFKSCISVTELDVSKFDTSNVKDMGQMFLKCLDLESVNATNFDTCNVILMEEMFKYCMTLKSLDVGNFKTLKVKCFDEMFYACSNLTTLDLHNFVFDKECQSDCIFYGMEKLSKLTMPLNVSLDIELPNYVWIEDEEIEDNYVNSTDFVWKDANGNVQEYALTGLSEPMTYTKYPVDQADEHIHSLKAHAASPATCMAAGNIAYWHCDKCGKYFDSEDALHEITLESTVIKATGHKWDNGTVTREATATEDGVKTFKCTNAGCTETKTEVIPKTGENGGNAIEQKPAQATGQKPEQSTPNQPQIGDTVTDQKTDVTYTVTENVEENKTVAYTQASDDAKGTVKVPATVTINDTTYKVTKIEDKAFAGNKKITKVMIGSNVTEIGAGAFSGCSKLKTVAVGSKVTKIDSNAFKGCTSLTKMTIPAKTTKIGANAFNGCKKIKTITIKSTKLTDKSISKNAFKGLPKGTTIKVPKKKLSTYKKLFKKKGLSSKVKVTA